MRHLWKVESVILETRGNRGTETRGRSFCTAKSGQKDRPLIKVVKRTVPLSTQGTSGSKISPLPFESVSSSDAVVSCAGSVPSLLDVSSSREGSSMLSSSV